MADKFQDDIDFAQLGQVEFEKVTKLLLELYGEYPFFYRFRKVIPPRNIVSKLSEINERLNADVGEIEYSLDVWVLPIITGYIVDELKSEFQEGWQVLFRPSEEFRNAWEYAYKGAYFDLATPIENFNGIITKMMTKKYKNFEDLVKKNLDNIDGDTYEEKLANTFADFKVINQEGRETLERKLDLILEIEERNYAKMPKIYEETLTRLRNNTLPKAT